MSLWKRTITVSFLKINISLCSYRNKQNSPVTILLVAREFLYWDASGHPVSVSAMRRYAYLHFCSCTQASRTAIVVKFTMSRDELAMSVKWIGLFKPICIGPTNSATPISSIIL